MWLPPRGDENACRVGVQADMSLEVVVVVRVQPLLDEGRQGDALVEAGHNLFLPIWLFVHRAYDGDCGYRSQIRVSVDQTPQRRPKPTTSVVVSEMPRHEGQGGRCFLVDTG